MLDMCKYISVCFVVSSGDFYECGDFHESVDCDVGRDVALERYEHPLPPP